MPKKKRELSPETIKKLRDLELDINIQSISKFKFEPFCNLAEIKKQKAERRKKQLEAKQKAEKEKAEIVIKPPEIDNETLAIMYGSKDFKKGWDYQRAEQARQRIAINKPWIYSTGATSLVGKKIVSKNAFKHGLYAKVLQSSNLQSVEFSVTPADLELNEEINDTSSAENEDELKRLDPIWYNACRDCKE